MDRSGLAKAIRERSRLSGRFVLRSGETSDTYFDKYLFESDPRVLRAIAEHLSELVPEGTQILCGLEMGGIPVVSVLSQVTGLPCAFLRKERKSHGTMKYAEGPDLEGRTIVLVEDVVSSGGAIIDQVTMLRSDGIDIHTAICVIDRQTGGSEALAREGVRLVPLFTMKDIDDVPEDQSEGLRQWSIEDSPADEDLAVVSAGVIEFGRAEAAGGNPEPIACFLRDRRSIIAGASGRTEFGRLFVDYLWVQEELRGAGLGRAALERIEGAAYQRGARDSLIETLSDRNAALYRRCGYVEVASISRYVGRFSKHVMLKTL